MSNKHLLIVNAAEVLTCAGFSGSPARGADQGALGIIKGGAVAISNDKIVAVGSQSDLEKAYPMPDAQVIDAAGGVVLPG